MTNQLQGNQKILLSKRNASFLLCSILTVSSVNIWKGASDVFTNPQYLTDQSLHAIYDRGYNREPYATINGNYNYQYGMFSVLLNIGIAIYSTELLLKIGGKAEQYEPVAPISLQPSVDTEKFKKETKLKEQRKEYHEFRKDALAAYVNRIIVQNPMINSVLESNVDICVGEPSAGKSRFAMILAVCKAVKRGDVGTAIDILDTQDETKNIAEETWVAGQIHTSVTSNFLQLLSGKGRNKRSPYRAFLVDEVNKLVSNPETAPVLATIYRNAKEELRNQNMSYTITCHTLQKHELTDGSDEMAALRVSLLRSASIFYFPSTRNAQNKPIKSDVVFFRTGYVDGMPLPNRVNNTNDFNEVGDWEIFSIPKDLDPSVMARNINVQLAALELNPMYAVSTSTVTKSKKIKQVYNRNTSEDTVKLGDREVANEFGDDLKVYRITQIKRTSLTDLEQKFLDSVFTKIREDESVVTHKVGDLNIFEITSEVILKCFRDRIEWQNTLESLSDRNIGKLSASGKYWLHPKEDNSNGYN